MEPGGENMKYQKYDFQPDYRNMVRTANNQWVDRVPLYEHIVGPKVIEEITGNRPYDDLTNPDENKRRRAFEQVWAFWREMGYDTASVEFCICQALINGNSLYGHEEAAFDDREGFEKYPWDEIPDIFFERFGPAFRTLAETCPPGMKAVGGPGNGIFETAQDLVGYMNLCYISAEDPELYEDIFKAVGKMHYTIWERFLREYSDAYCLLRFGDDLGFKTSTLINPKDIRKHILPHYTRAIEMVHATGRPFLLHSCGKIFDVMDDIIATGIDGKHSNEDTIARFPVWVEKYGDRIANFGGLDTDTVCRNKPEDIRKEVFEILDAVKGHGGIAFSTGNSIPDYVPTEGYLAMIEAVRDWRGDRRI